MGSLRTRFTYVDEDMQPRRLHEQTDCAEVRRLAGVHGMEHAHPNCSAYSLFLFVIVAATH